MTALTEAELKCLKTYASKHYTQKQLDWFIKRFGETRIRTRFYVSNWDKDRPLYMRCPTDPYFLENCCGVAELRSTGLSLNELNDCMLDFWTNNAKHVIATCNHKQKKVFAMLKKWGFSVVKDWTVNPNTGNKIAVLMYTFPD
jgi:hypothetical protein